MGLDLQPSRTGLTISASATGEAPAAQAPAPASKDLLCVSGALGAAYFGLRVLERGKSRFEAGSNGSDEEMERYRMLVASYLRPELPAGLPSLLRDAGITPSASYFVDRGLADALLRLVSDTGLGAKDDCRVLLVVPIAQFEAFRRDFQTFDIIGHLAQSEVGAVLVSPDGLEHPVSAPGWNAKDNH